MKEFRWKEFGSIKTRSPEPEPSQSLICSHIISSLKIFLIPGNIPNIFNMKPILALCLLATAVVARPNAYQTYSQPATSQSYSGPNQSYSSQPVAYIAPSITFSPPQIQYSQPSITYSNPSTVPMAMPEKSSYSSSSYGSSSGSSYNQSPLVLGYQPQSGYSSGSSSSSSSY